MRKIQTEEKTPGWSVRLERANQRRWWDRLAQVYTIYETVSNQVKEG